MEKTNLPKKVGYRFSSGNNYGKGRPKGTYNKDRLVKEIVTEDTFKSIVTVISEKALSGDLGAAKMVFDLIPRERFISHNSLAKIETLEQVDKAMEDTLTLVGSEALSLDDAESVANLIGKKYQTILTTQDKLINEILESGKMGAE